MESNYRRYLRGLLNRSREVSPDKSKSMSQKSSCSPIHIGPNQVVPSPKKALRSPDHGSPNQSTGLPGRLVGSPNRSSGIDPNRTSPRRPGHLVGGRGARMFDSRVGESKDTNVPSEWAKSPEKPESKIMNIHSFCDVSDVRSMQSPQKSTVWPPKLSRELPPKLTRDSRRESLEGTLLFQAALVGLSPPRHAGDSPAHDSHEDTPQPIGENASVGSGKNSRKSTPSQTLSPTHSVAEHRKKSERSKFIDGLMDTNESSIFATDTEIVPDQLQQTNKTLAPSVYASEIEIQPDNQFQPEVEPDTQQLQRLISGEIHPDYCKLEAHNFPSSDGSHIESARSRGGSAILSADNIFLSKSTGHNRLDGTILSDSQASGVISSVGNRPGVNRPGSSSDLEVRNLIRSNLLEPIGSNLLEDFAVHDPSFHPDCDPDGEAQVVDRLSASDLMKRKSLDDYVADILVQSGVEDLHGYLSGRSEIPDDVLTEAKKRSLNAFVDHLMIMHSSANKGGRSASSSLSPNNETRISPATSGDVSPAPHVQLPFPSPLGFPATPAVTTPLANGTVTSQADPSAFPAGPLQAPSPLTLTLANKSNGPPAPLLNGHLSRISLWARQSDSAAKKKNINDLVDQLMKEEQESSKETVNLSDASSKDTATGVQSGVVSSEELKRWDDEKRREAQAAALKPAIKADARMVGCKKNDEARYGIKTFAEPNLSHAITPGETTKEIIQTGRESEVVETVGTHASSGELKSDMEVRSSFHQSSVLPSRSDSENEFARRLYNGRNVQNKNNFACPHNVEKAEILPYAASRMMQGLSAARMYSSGDYLGTEVGDEDEDDSRQHRRRSKCYDDEKAENSSGSGASAPSASPADYPTMDSQNGCRPPTAGMVTSVTGESMLLREQTFRQLWEYLPMYTRQKERIALVFSPKRDGVSVKSLLRVYESNPGTIYETLMMIRDTNGRVFGAFCTEPWTVNERYYGGGQSFVFADMATGNSDRESQKCSLMGNMKNKLKVWPYMPQKKCSLFQYCDGEYIAVGAASSIERPKRPGRHRGIYLDPSEMKRGPAIVLEEYLLRGCSRPCDTYGTTYPLAASTDFVITDLEVWGFVD